LRDPSEKPLKKKREGRRRTVWEKRYVTLRGERKKEVTAPVFPIGSREKEGRYLSKNGG